MENAKGTALIVGPSHAIRLKLHVRDKVVPSPLKPERIIGRGGAPIWSKLLFENAKESLGPKNTMVVIVPDFRMGNGIALQSPVPPVPPFRDVFFAIDRSAMTLEHDQTMLKLGMAGLRVWHDHFGPRARYVFWSLFGRQVHDRIAGKHITDGRYHSPVFNYNEITAALPDLDVIDLQPLLKLPMHEVRRLFIDTSSHPSQIGYLLLNGLIFDGLEARVAYDQAVATVEADLIALAQNIRAAVGRKVLLTGRSVWLNVVMWLLGASGAVKLAEAGLVLAPLNRSAGQLPISEILEREALADCASVVVSAAGADLSGVLAKAFRTKPEFWRSIPIIDWESATEAAIRGRGEVPMFARTEVQLLDAASEIRLDLLSHMVEQGPLGMPSWTGITHLLGQLPAIINEAPDRGQNAASSV